MNQLTKQQSKKLVKLWREQLKYSSLTAKEQVRKAKELSRKGVTPN